MIKNIIFDWSGTLSDNLHPVYETCMIMFEQLGGKRISVEEFRKKHTSPYMKFWHQFFPRLTKEKQDNLYEKAIQKVPKAKLYPGVNEALKLLNARGINLFILSSEPYSYIVEDLEKEGILRLFEKIEARVHDKVEAIRGILDEYRFDPNETAYIGDVEGDVEAGRNASVKTVAISWGFNSKERLEKSGPDLLIDNLLELVELLQ